MDCTDHDHVVEQIDYHSVEEDIFHNNDNDVVFQQIFVNDDIGNKKEGNVQKRFEPKNCYPNGMEKNLVYQSIEKQNHLLFYDRENDDFLEENNHHRKFNRRGDYYHAGPFLLRCQIDNQKNDDRQDVLDRVEFKLNHNNETTITTNYGHGLDWNNELQLDDVGDCDNDNTTIAARKVSDADDHRMEVEENVFVFEI